MMHPQISMMNSREKRRMMLAQADRRALIRQARDETRTARRLRQPAERDSGAARRRRLHWVLLGRQE